MRMDWSGEHSYCGFAPEKLETTCRAPLSLADNPVLGEFRRPF